MKFLGFLLLVNIISLKSTVQSLGHTLPKNFRQCRQNDPAVGKCLQGALHDAFEKMKNAGIPSLGVLPLEPLVVNDIQIDPGAGGPVTLKLHFQNLKMYGIPTSNITDYRANFDDARLMTTALTSKLWFEADYNADGKVLLLPVRGSGKCNVTLFDLKTTTDLKFHPEKKNGETYWIIQTFKNKFTPKKVTVYFDGLLRGERRLNSGINNFLNDNWKVVFEELGPSFEEAFGAVFKEITHRVFIGHRDRLSLLRENLEKVVSGSTHHWVYDMTLRYHKKKMGRFPTSVQAQFLFQRVTVTPEAPRLTQESFSLTSFVSLPFLERLLEAVTKCYLFLANHSAEEN